MSKIQNFEDGFYHSAHCCESSYSGFYCSGCFYCDALVQHQVSAFVFFLLFFFLWAHPGRSGFLSVAAYGLFGAGLVYGMLKQQRVHNTLAENREAEIAKLEVSNVALRARVCSHFF